MSTKKTEVIARGAFVSGGRLLVCRNRKKKNVFLPGGHIEWNESARTALRRELVEEMGRRSKVGRFLGACEHRFVWKGERVCEINAVFEFSIPGLRPPKPGPSKEKNLEFIWVPLSTLARSRLEPHSLRRVLRRWLRNRRVADNWSSTY